MDQNTLTSMDNGNKKLAVRPAQQSVKSHGQDHSKDGSKRSGASRRQREYDRGDGVGGAAAGGGGRNSNRLSLAGGQGAPSGRGTWGRSGNKSYKNREKESGQVGSEVDWSHGPVDEDDLNFSIASRGGGGSGLRNHSNNITHTVVGWWTGGGGGPNSRRNGGAGGASRNRKKRYHQGSAVTKMRQGNKHFLQASCQFVVNPVKEAREQVTASVPVGCAAPAAVVKSVPTSSMQDVGTNDSRGPVNSTVGDVSVNSSALEVSCATSSSSMYDDPDMAVSWSAVEEVVLHMTEPTQCPICLYPPVAPQVTKCGHLYCYPCILHYLALSDKKWRSCPICDELIVRDDLKSAVCVVHPGYGVGSSIEMTLMRRDRHSMLPSPLHPPPHYTPNTHARKSRANMAKMMSIIDREVSALEVQMAAEGSQPEACFIEQALALVKEREAKLHLDYEEDEGAAASLKSSSDAVTDEVTRQLVDATQNITLQEDASNAPCDDEKTVKVPGKNKYGKATVDLYEVKNSTHNLQDRTGSSRKKNNKENSRSSSNRNARSSRGASFQANSQKCSSDSTTLQFGSFNFEELENSAAEESSSVEDLEVEGNMVAEFSDTDADDTILGTVPVKQSDSTALPVCTKISDAGAGVTPAARNTESLQFEFQDEIAAKEKESLSSGPTTAPVTAATSSSRTSNAPKSTYYFYQASDGSHVYLHALNTAMLCRQYGAEELCPPTITATVVEKEYGVVEEVIRRRMKYLRHLPLFCPYEMVEVALNPPIVTQDTIVQFQASLSRREQQRLTRVKAEQVIEKRVQAQQDKELSSCMYTKVCSAFNSSAAAREQQQQPVVYLEDWTGSVTSDEAFPHINNTGDHSNGSITGGRHSVSSDGASSPEFANSPPADGGLSQQQPSFARMLRSHQSSSRNPKAAWPSLGRPPAGAGGAAWNSSAPQAAAWGNGSNSASQQAAAEEENEEAQFNVPDYKQTFSKAFDAMLQQAGTSGKKGKKNKRKSKQVLLL